MLRCKKTQKKVTKWCSTFYLCLGRQKIKMFSRKSAYQSGKIFCPKHRPPLPPENIAGTQWVDATELPEGLCQRHHRESNSQPSDLQCTASSNRATACPRVCSTCTQSLCSQNTLWWRLVYGWYWGHTFRSLSLIYQRPTPESLPAVFSCSGDSYKNDDSSEDRVIPRGVHKKKS
jgi:hypothetical protein